MPKKGVPTYRRHRNPTRGDRAFVELSGRRYYLGDFDSPESKERYARLLAEWQAGGGNAPLGKKETEELTVIELVSRFWTFHETYYRRPDGTVGRELANHRSALRPLKDLYRETLVKDFGPVALEAIRERLIAQNICRKYVNRSIGRIKRVFRWGVAKQLVPSSVYEALRCVEGLKRGRGGARETAPVKPVPPEHVEAVRPHVSAQVWALIQLQLLTGARSGELVVLRPFDLDRSAPVWIYRPAEHKTSHHGHERVIYLGPQAQDVLRPFLLRRPEEFCFSPAEAEEVRRGPPGRSRLPGRLPRAQYDANSYGNAIRRACKKAKVPHWHPHQLRHTAATKLRREFGLDFAGVILGHKGLDVTQLYAEADKTRAVEIMGRIG